MQSPEKECSIDKNRNGNIPSQLLIGIDIYTLQQTNGTLRIFPTLEIVDNDYEEQGEDCCGRYFILQVGRTVGVGFVRVFAVLDVGLDVTDPDYEGEGQQHGFEDVDESDHQERAIGRGFIILLE